MVCKVGFRTNRGRAQWPMLIRRTTRRTCRQRDASATWNGDTLIVDTNGFRDGLWLDFAGNILTDSAKLKEKFRGPAFGALDIEVTVDDRKAYTRPFTFTVHQILMLDTELLEFVCLENERDQPHLIGK